MKYQRKTSVFFAFTCMLVITQTLVSQNLFVGEFGDKSKIMITNHQLNKYMNGYEIGENIQINEMMISEFANQNFLLARDVEGGWVYVMKLKTRGKRLFLEKNKTINACQSNKLSIDLFNFENGEIMGCAQHNHKIIKK